MLKSVSRTWIYTRKSIQNFYWIMFYESLQARFTKCAIWIARGYIHGHEHSLSFSILTWILANQHYHISISYFCFIVVVVVVLLLSLTIFTLALCVSNKNNVNQNILCAEISVVCWTTISNCQGVSVQFTVFKRLWSFFFYLFCLCDVTQSYLKVLIDWTEIWETFSTIRFFSFLSLFPSVFLCLSPPLSLFILISSPLRRLFPFDEERNRWKNK